MDILVVALSLVVAFLWAVNVVIHKYGLQQSINSKTVAVIAGFVYFICIFGFALYHYKELYIDIQNTNSSTNAIIAIGAVLGLFIGNLLFINLLEKNKSSIVTTIAYTTPLFVLLLALLFLKNETVTGMQMLGIFVTVIGIMILCYELSPS